MRTKRVNKGGSDYMPISEGKVEISDAQAAQTSPRVPGRSGEGGLCYVVYFVTGLQTTEKDVAERMQVLPHGDLCWCGDPQLHRCQH